MDSEDSLEIATYGSVVSILAIIGIDPDRPSIYRLVVSFDFGTPDYGAEFNFWIEEESESGSETFLNGLETRFIHGPDRNAVLECVLTAARMLISAVGPECVSMVSLTGPNPPPKAIAKYLRIINIFAEMGFQVRPRTDNGYFSWLMTRS
jgi:hypothetical protein